MTSDDNTASSPEGRTRPGHDIDDELYGSETEEFEGHEDDEEGVEDEGQPVEWFDEQGRRHVRRAAPEGTEELLEKEAPRETGLPDRIEKWRQRSAAGAVATAFALGLQAALDTERKEPAIIMETSGEPPTDLPVEAQLEQLGPRQSTVTVRRWLLSGDERDERVAGADRGEDHDERDLAAPDEATEGEAQGQ